MGELELEISIKDIFKYKTIESLFDNILGKRINKRLKIRREEGILEGEVKLLAIQEWFFNNKYVRQEHWNQSFLIKVSELDIDKLSEAVGKLVIWHDALRMRYEIIKENGSIRYMQYYTGKEEVKLKLLNIEIIKDKDDEEKQKIISEELTKWQSNFDLKEGPIYSIGYINGYKDGSARIYFAVHHLVIDGVSWRILTEDLKRLYQGKELGLKG